MDKETLEKLSPSALSEFLKTDVGIPLSICQAFEEELVDGPALLDLTEEDVKEICKKIGPTKKVCRFINQVLGDKSEVISTVMPFVGPSSSQFNPNVSSLPIAHSPSLSDIPSSPVSRKSKLKSFSSSLSHNDPSSPISFISSPSPLTCTDSDECSSSISSLHVSSKFCIPDTWRPSIMECINAPTETEARRLLTPKIRSEIVRDLVTQMYTVWPNPKSAESAVVARKLVSKYVFMKDKGQAVSGYGSWERKIIDRIHNVSVSVKRKETNESSDAPVSKRGRPKSTTLASRYPPLQHDFSDDTSFNRNIDKIKSEMSTSNPRKQVLLKLMEDTYARRREMVLGKQGIVSVSHVLELFPCLKMYSILNQEVSLVLDKDVLTPGLASWKSTWVSAIIDYSESLKSKAMVQARQQYKEAYEGDEECNEKLALSMLVQMLGKKTLCNIYKQYELMDNPDEVARKNISPYPLIGYFTNGVGEPSYFVFVEGQILVKLNLFTKALGIWLFSHYIFNLEYFKDIKDCALFLQEFVFSLPSGQKKTSSYLSVTTSIKSYADFSL